MSRRRSFIYHVGPRDEIPESAWDSVFCASARCSRREPIPCKYLGGGFGDEHGWNIWLEATRAKAHRLKVTLDKVFGREGELLDVTDWDWESDLPYPWEIRNG